MHGKLHHRIFCYFSNYHISFNIFILYSFKINLIFIIIYVIEDDEENCGLQFRKLKDLYCRRRSGLSGIHR